MTSTWPLWHRSEGRKYWMEKRVVRRLRVCFGLIALVAPASATVAAEFDCSSTVCLGLAIFVANGTAEADTINLETGTYDRH